MKSDIYSLGVVAYQMATGRLPFNGPDTPDFRVQHLSTQPDPPSGVSPAIRSLILWMLAKHQNARPTPQEVLDLLPIAATPQSSSVKVLQRLSAQRVEKISEEEANAAQERLRQEDRQDFVNAAQLLLSNLFHPITSTFDSMRGIDSGLRQGRRGGLNERYFTVGQATLTLSEAVPPGWKAHPLQVSLKADVPFDVVLYSSIGVEIRDDLDDALVAEPGYLGKDWHTKPAVRRAEDRVLSWKGRSHSLWYCDARTIGEYHWYETAFRKAKGYGSLIEPFALTPGLLSAQSAIRQSAIRHSASSDRVARPFTALIGSSAEEFVNRWLSWFARAAEGRLNRPAKFPEGKTTGSWRIS